MKTKKGLQPPERKDAPVVADDCPDADLFARVAEFYPALEKHNIADEASSTRRAEAEAMSDLPAYSAPAFDKAAHDRWHAFMKAQGVWRLWAKTEAAGRAMGKAANAVFAIPARTYRGAVEKVKIAYFAVGDEEGSGTGDADLAAYQDLKNPWMANAIADLERLTGASATALLELDPAVAALAEYMVAKAADDAISDKDAEAETPEYLAAGDRRYAAGDAVCDAVPTSMAGVGAKVRFIFDHQERGNDLWPAFDTMAKSMLPFLEGAPAPAPKPDPVVTLFAEWGTIQDEATALSAANPEAKSGELNDRWEAALDRLDVVGDKIMSTPATSIKGVAVKIRLASHYAFDVVELAPLHNTLSRDIDYEPEGGAGGALNDYLVSALRDAERLAGVS